MYLCLFEWGRGEGKLTGSRHDDGKKARSCHKSLAILETQTTYIQNENGDNLKRGVKIDHAR